MAENKKFNNQNMDVIVNLCKDIARHASQLEAECQGIEQSTTRYLELKELLTNHYLFNIYNNDNFSSVREEIYNSIKHAINYDENGNAKVCPTNHLISMLNFFMMLIDEVNRLPL